jgi:hypothetical protein
MTYVLFFALFFGNWSRPVPPQSHYCHGLPECNARAPHGGGE